MIPECHQWNPMNARIVKQYSNLKKNLISILLKNIQKLNDNKRPILDMLMVAIDISNVSFT